jgi:hypothetical protein
MGYAYAMQREQYRPPLSVAPSAPDGSTMRFRRALRWSSAEPLVPWFIDAVEEAEWYPDYCTHKGFTHGVAADPFAAAALPSVRSSRSAFRSQQPLCCPFAAAALLSVRSHLTA